MQRFLTRAFVTTAAVTIMLLAGRQPVLADGPNFQTIAHWDRTRLSNGGTQGCVTSQSVTDDTEDIVKQTLAVEMAGDGVYKMEALKANATIIRQDSLYYRYHPENLGWSWFCPDATVYAFDWRDSIMAFVSGAHGAEQYAAVNATWGIGWFKSVGVPQTDFNFQPWGSNMQNCTQTQAEAGFRYQAIVGLGIYPPGVFASSAQITCLPEDLSQPPALPHPLAPVYVFCHWNPSGKVDHDCDGYSSEVKDYIGADSLGRCYAGFESGPSWGWPSDFVSGGLPNSTDRITVTDLTSYLAPVRRLETSPGSPRFSARWDLVPGPGMFSSWINVTDITALIAGLTGYPPMFEGQRALGMTCTNHPVYLL